MAASENKVQFNLKNVHYAVMTVFPREREMDLKILRNKAKVNPVSLPS